MNRPLIKGTKLHKASVLKAKKQPVVAQTRTQADASLVGAGRELGKSIVPGQSDYDLRYNPEMDFSLRTPKEEDDELKTRVEKEEIVDDTIYEDDEVIEEKEVEKEVKKDKKKKKKEKDKGKKDGKTVRDRIISTYNRIKKKIEDKKIEDRKNITEKDTEKASLDKEAETAQDAGKPQRSDYNNPSDHMRALMEWHKKQEEEKKEVVKEDAYDLMDEVDKSNLQPRPKEKRDVERPVNQLPRIEAKVPELTQNDQLPKLELAEELDISSSKVLPAHENPKYKQVDLLNPDRQKLDTGIDVHDRFQRDLFDSEIEHKDYFTAKFDDYAYTTIAVDEDENGEKDGIFEEQEFWTYKNQEISESEVPSDAFTFIMNNRIKSMKGVQNKNSSPAQLRDSRIFKNATPGGIVQKTMLKNGYIPKN